MKFDTSVNMYVRKWRLLLVLHLTILVIKENKEVKVLKNRLRKLRKI